MASTFRRSSAGRVPRWAIMGMALFASIGPVRAADTVLLLDVRINGFAVGNIGEFLSGDDGMVRIRPSELRALGLKGPVTDTDEPVALGSLPGVSVRIDAATQSVDIEASDAALIPVVIAADHSATVPTPTPTPAGRGGVFDYDLTLTRTPRGMSAGGLLGARLFSPAGVFSTTGLVATSSGRHQVVRLDTSVTQSNLAANSRIVLGDHISGTPGWGRPIRLGGVQLTSDFRMRPDLITFPLPSVSGSVAVPSTVDVLINGTKMLSRRVTGPFEVQQLPVATGAGTIALAVTDALGRQRVTTLPFYASAALLVPGLQTYAVQAGLIRRDFGQRSNSYGKLSISGTYRRGLSDHMTIEGGGEATAGFATGSIGATWNLADVALATVATGVSFGAFGSGAQAMASVQHTSGHLSLGASASVATRNFRDVAGTSGDPITRAMLSLHAGLAMGQFGALAATYNAVEGPANAAQNARIATLSYSAQINRLALNASGYRSFGHAGGSGVTIGLSMAFGGGTSGGINARSGAGERDFQAQVSKSVSGPGDLGYELALSNAGRGHQFGELTYQSPVTTLTAGGDRLGRALSGRLGARGSVASLDGGLFAATAINDSFAVVDTGGLAGVRVMQENRLVGRTGRSGRLLVPGLRSFDRNGLSIDPSDVPMDADLDTAEQVVRPPDRAGVVVRFRIATSQAALLTLVDERGAPLDLGSVATVRGSKLEFPVGYDGAAYVEGLAAHNLIDVSLASGHRCTAAVDYSPLAGAIPTIGPVICKAQT